VKWVSLLLLSVTVLLSSSAHAEWIREIEITSDPEVDGKKIFTVRFMPKKTFKYDRILFDCVYRQELPWENARGKKYTKVYEPVSFTYRHSDVKLVNDLDHYSSFRVPIGLKRLQAIYGPKLFNKVRPITIARMKISGISKGKTIWSYELAAKGKHVIADLKHRRKKPGIKDDVDLDSPKPPAADPKRGS